MRQHTLHVYATHDAAKRALKAFADANPQAVIRVQDKDATTDSEYHRFVRFTKDEDWQRLAGSEWHSLKVNHEIPEMLKIKLATRIRLF